MSRTINTSMPTLPNNALTQALGRGSGTIDTNTRVASQKRSHGLTAGELRALEDMVIGMSDIQRDKLMDELKNGDSI